MVYFIGGGGGPIPRSVYLNENANVHWENNKASQTRESQQEPRPSAETAASMHQEQHPRMESAIEEDSEMTDQEGQHPESKDK